MHIGWKNAFQRVVQDDWIFDPVFSCLGNLEAKTCPADFDKDQDVDGRDVAQLAADPSQLGLRYFAPDFGKRDCF